MNLGLCGLILLSVVAEESEPQEKANGGLRTLNLVRGYVLLVVGIGLIIYSFVGKTKPGALTLGGALVGFNPLFQATVGGHK